MDDIRRLTYIVTVEDDGFTVEHVLRCHLHMSRHAIRHAKFEQDGLMVDGERVLSVAKVHTGQTVSVVVGDSPEALRSSDIVPNAALLEKPLTLVYEDDDLMVIDKRPGMVVHPCPGHYTDSLANQLAAYFAVSGQTAIPHPVQRLDKDTSGLLVTAKNAHAHDRLQRMLHTADFIREYRAICIGEPQPHEGLIDKPIGRRDEHSGYSMVRPDGKPARTFYEVLSTWNVPQQGQPDAQERLSLVRLRLDTGRTHQIRVHLASIGCPLLGDNVYGNASALIARPALHSAHLELLHPVTEVRLAFDAPLPDDMRCLIPKA